MIPPATVNTPIVNIAAYRFVALDDLPARRETLRSRCTDRGLKGTILLSPEGINLFLAGTREAVDALLVDFSTDPLLADLDVKESLSARQPFRRLLVKIKPEIIACGIDEIDPAQHTSAKLTPAELNRWLEEGREVTLLDVRNDYEVELGTFTDARSIGIDHFRDFPAAINSLPDETRERMQQQPVVMFCTGGIRCEKAGPIMERAGFDNVYQLEGGILKYFEEIGGEHYDGACFVFDQRVAVDSALAETDHRLCFACQVVLTRADCNDSRYVPGESCPHCFITPQEQSATRLKERAASLAHATLPLPGSIPHEQQRPLNVPMRCDWKTLLEFVSTRYPQCEQQEWRTRIDDGHVVLNGQPVDADRIVRSGEQYVHRVADVTEPAVASDVDWLYEDDDIIVLNKPAPLPMHPSGRFRFNTLTHFLELVYRPQKPRPVHRLDANTTGIVLFAKTRNVAGRLQPQFEQGAVQKVYLARVQRHPDWDTTTCEASISARPDDLGLRRIDATGHEAQTEFHVLSRDADGTALIEARPLSGRTNQIRLHLWHLGLPICGDPSYLPNGSRAATQTRALDDPPMCLHAWQIVFTHPTTGKTMTFTAPASFCV